MKHDDDDDPRNPLDDEQWPGTTAYRAILGARGCSSAWTERHTPNVDVAGSIPVSPSRAN